MEWYHFHRSSTFKRHSHVWSVVVLNHVRFRQRKHRWQERSVVIMPEYLNVRDTERNPAWLVIARLWVKRHTLVAIDAHVEVIGTVYLSA
jgi:hypothetical protein